MNKAEPLDRQGLWRQIAAGQLMNYAPAGHVFSVPSAPTGTELNQLVKSIRRDETYNLGAQSHVRVSFEIPEYTSDVTGLGCVRLLEAMREADVPCRFYQAYSSEQYGKVVEKPQTERTPFNARSPYPRAREMPISFASGTVTAPS
jgi:GDP-mannose 4,6-dehydratase